MTLSVEHLPADVLGLAEQARGALAGRPRPGGLPGMLVPSTLEHMPAPEDRLDGDDRGDLSRCLLESLAPFEPHVAVLESARSISQPGVTLVIAGQQPGLFGGPLYNVYKALHAIRLARALSEHWQRPVVPAFWNHADDHDLAEVHHLWIQNPNLDLRKIGLAGMSSGREPLGRITFQEEKHGLAGARELLRQTLWDGDRTDRALELFLPREGESFSGAFTRVLLELFGHHGLVVIEPEWIREPLSRSLATLVTNDLHDRLQSGTEALRAAGAAPPIDVDSAALVFHIEDGRRRALRVRRASPLEFAYDGEPGSRTASELAAEIVQDPGDWSAGALLRPVAQDLTLPVSAYVGGWGELSYHAQLVHLREGAGAPVTPFVPRLSATLVDPEQRGSLDKLDLTLRDVLVARGRLESRDDESEEPAVVAKLRNVAGEAAEGLKALRSELAELDRGLAGQIKKTADQVRSSVEKLAAKAARVHANSQGKDRRHARRLENGLFPRGNPQERVRGTIEVVARFGTGWIDELLAEIEPLPTEHLAILLQDI